MTKYKRAGSHNYNDANAWSTSSGGAANTTVPTAADDIVLDALSGDLTITAAAVAKTIDATLFTGTLTHNAFTLTVSGSLTFSALMTYTPLATSTIIFNATATITTGGKLIPLLQHTSGTLTLGDNLTIMASKLITFTLSGTAVDLNGFVLSGNSATNRLKLVSSVLGTGRTLLNCLSSSFAHINFRDIIFTSASDLDLSAITGLSGDGGGNSITGGGAVLTFTSGVNDVVTASTSKSMSDVTIHSSGRVPLPQDNVSLSGWTGGTLTFDMPWAGRNIDLTGSSGTRTLGFNSTALSIFGSLTLAVPTGLTFSHNQTINFYGRGSFTFTTAGKSFGAGININMPGGTLTLQDSLTGTVNCTVTPNNGHFNSNGQAITVGALVSAVNTTRAITMAGTILTLLATSGTLWNFGTVTNLTVNSMPDEIIYSAASASTRTFAGGGKHYPKLTYTVDSSTGQLTISGNNTFDDLNVDDDHTIAFTAGSTQTFGAPGAFDSILGTSGHLVVLKSTVDGSTYNLVNATGQKINTDYLSIRDARGSGGHFYVGANSTNLSNNLGLIFSAAPPPSTGVKMFGDQGVIA